MKHPALKVAFIAGTIGFLWWWNQRTAAVADASSALPSDPIDSVFANNPGAWTWPNLGDQTINVNVGNQGFGFLSNAYMPLFGFVGMAQGANFQ